VHTIPDLFARKRLEDELREARDNLERRVAERTEELRTANERLQEEIANRAHVERLLVQSQKLEALGRLAGGIAHDFNNLLSIMGGYTELLLAELSPGEQAADFAQEIAASVKRASGLTQQLLVFSRQRVATSRVVDMCRVVARMRDLLQRLLGEDIQLRIALGGDPCQVRADPIQLEQVVINLAVNARDAMPEGGTLSIQVQLEDTVDAEGEAVPPRVQLIVEDDGHGMDEESLEHVFDPFFTTKAPGEGTGLGLAMVYGTVTQYGGEISAESEPDRGTRFRIRLPLAEGQPEANAEPPRTVPKATRPSRLLLVEDDDNVRALLVRALERAGHELLVAENAEQALELWNDASPRPAAVVTDVIMPGMSGSALAHQLRDEAPEIPVVYVSGYAADRLGEDTLTDPKTEFVQKPFDLHELIARLDALL
jgi:signal transduction histidine kinase